MKLGGMIFLAVLLVIPSTALAFAKRPRPVPSPSHGAHAPKYACPMSCVVSEKTGKCPKCGMEMGELSSEK